MTFPKGYKPPKDYKPPREIIPWRERKLRCKLGIHSHPGSRKDPYRGFTPWYCKLCGEYVPEHNPGGGG